MLIRCNLSIGVGRFMLYTVLVKVLFIGKNAIFDDLWSRRQKWKTKKYLRLLPMW